MDSQTVYAVAYKSGEVPPVVGFVDDLVRCETRLYNVLNDRLREQHGVVNSQLELLRFVGHHPGTRVADIAETFAIGVGASSKSLDRLERSGWVRRLPNPDDRRSSLVELTESGTRLLEEAEVTCAETLAPLLGQAGAAGELASAGAFLGRLRASLEAGGVGLPTG
jgi:MarR family multiple antibiotic resistance transcriptional regulator